MDRETVELATDKESSTYSQNRAWPQKLWSTNASVFRIKDLLRTANYELRIESRELAS
jgi:hypothetical protein